MKALWQASTDVVWWVVWWGLTDVVCSQTRVSSLSTPWFLCCLFCEHILALLTHKLWVFCALRLPIHKSTELLFNVVVFVRGASVSKVTEQVAVCRRSQANLHFVRVLPVFCLSLLKDIAVAFDCDISWVCPFSVGWKRCLGALGWKIKKRTAKLINYWHWYSTFAHVRLCVYANLCVYRL